LAYPKKLERAVTGKKMLLFGYSAVVLRKKLTGQEWLKFQNKLLCAGEIQKNEV